MGVLHIPHSIHIRLRDLMGAYRVHPDARALHSAMGQRPMNTVLKILLIMVSIACTPFLGHLIHVKLGFIGALVFAALVIIVVSVLMRRIDDLDF